MDNQRKQVRGLGTLARRGNLWHIQFSVDGRQYRESAHTENYNEAVRKLKQRIAEVRAGKFVGLHADRILMSELLADVIADYELKERRSIDKMARPLINNRLIPYFGEMRAVNVRVSNITAYMKLRQKEGAAVASLNVELSLLRRSFKLGRENGKVNVAYVPDFKGLVRDPKNARRGFWEHHEYQAFRDALPLDERPVFIFGYWTGCRFGEIIQLQWDQVDLPGKVVRLAADQTKSGAARMVPLGGPGAELYETLLAQKERRAALCPESPWVFFRQGSSDPKRKSMRRGRPVEDLRKAWASAQEGTGITLLFHDLRRTGVRNLVRSGVPEKVAMLISGHKTRNVFERYNVADERDLHDAADRLGRYLAGKT